MKFPIPEVDSRFSCKEDILDYFIRVCNVIVEKANDVYPKHLISNIPGYVLAFSHKVLLLSSTLVYVSRERKDYGTVCSLVRILADNIATINLIYNRKNSEESILRHLLYVMDGFNQRYQLLKDRPKPNNGRIPKDTYDALCKQVERAKENAFDCIAFSEKSIKRRPGYADNKKNLDILIIERNWKFKNLNTPHKRDGYTWKDMYGLLDINTADEMFPFLSQYVHGLSVSNISVDDKEDFDSPLSYAVCLLGWLCDFLRKKYESKIGDFTMEEVRKMAPPEMFGEK